MSIYIASPDRYQQIPYKRCGHSGLKLPALSLGLWHNFGFVDQYETSRQMILRSFDLGITHFDLANNYGPPPGSAETTFGLILHKDLAAYRDELIISSKAGYTMWEGPYGDFGSRKYLMASLHQSLKRMKLDYVDIFYHHRPDPETPLEESMRALHDMIVSGKALYAGISNYPAPLAKQAAEMMRSWGTPLVIHQPKYSMFERWVEKELLDVLEEQGMGCIPFSPLAQGLLTQKYLGGIPEDSRAAKSHGFLQTKQITEERLRQITGLNEIAQNRNQTLAQMAIAWLMKDARVTSVLIGASKVQQIEDCLGCLKNLKFDQSELAQIEELL